MNAEITEEMNRVEEEMKRISPQFFLRNIGRMELEADEDMEMATQATEKGLIREEKLEEARATARARSCLLVCLLVCLPVCLPVGVHR